MLLKRLISLHISFVFCPIILTDLYSSVTSKIDVVEYVRERVCGEQCEGRGVWGRVCGDGCKGKGFTTRSRRVAECLS